MRLICLIMTLLISNVVLAEDISLNCQMSGTSSDNGKPRQIASTPFLVSITSSTSFLTINVDEVNGKAFISLISQNSADSIASNQSNDNQYNLFVRYESYGMKGFERVQINRKTGAAVFDKELVSRGSKVDFHLSGICKKIESNKF